MNNMVNCKDCAYKYNDLKTTLECTDLMKGVIKQYEREVTMCALYPEHKEVRPDHFCGQGVRIVTQLS